MDKLGKILIVDDEAMVTKTLSMLLGLEGFSNVVTFDNPIDALKHLKENEFDYCPTWEDTNIDHTIKNKRWNHFCECVKNGEYNIDSNKHL